MKGKVAVFGLALGALAAVLLTSLSKESWAYWAVLGVAVLASAAAAAIYLLDLFQASPALREITVSLVCVIVAVSAGLLLGWKIASPSRSGSPSFARLLSVSSRRLNEDYVTLQQSLAIAKTREGQAHYAAKLGARFAAEAQQLRRVRVRPAELTVHLRITSALAALARSYAGLADSVRGRTGSQGKLDLALGRVNHAGARLWRSEQRLAEVGYEPEALPWPHIRTGK